MEESKLNKEIQAFKDVFSTEAGRLIMENLRRNFGISNCFLNKSTPIDPYRTHVHVGQLQLLGHIEAQINRDLIQEKDDG